MHEGYLASVSGSWNKTLGEKLYKKLQNAALSTTNPTLSDTDPLRGWSDAGNYRVFDRTMYNKLNYLAI
jgi:hypothetical protein